MLKVIKKEENNMDKHIDKNLEKSFKTEVYQAAHHIFLKTYGIVEYKKHSKEIFVFNDLGKRLYGTVYLKHIDDIECLKECLWQSLMEEKMLPNNKFTNQNKKNTMRIVSIPYAIYNFGSKFLQETFNEISNLAYTFV